MLGYPGIHPTVEQYLIAIVDYEEALRQATESLPRLAGFKAKSFGSAEAKVLGGAKPGALPIEGPANFEFVFNLKTARELQLALPDTASSGVAKLQQRGRGRAVAKSSRSISSPRPARGCHESV